MKCGRCRGRGHHRPVGLGPDVECEDCGGTGEKQPKSRGRIDVDYDRAADHCIYEGRVKGRECYGRKTWDHIVRREAIINRIAGKNRKVDVDTAKRLRDILADPRNLLPACLGCNLLREAGNPLAQPHPSDLPRGFWDFVAQHDLHGDVPRHLKHLDPGRPAADNPESAAPGRSAGDPGSHRRVA